MFDFVDDPAFQLLVILIDVKEYNDARERHNLHRSALHNPSKSAWRHLLENGDDPSFLTITGFTRHAFYELYRVLWTRNEMIEFDDHENNKFGRKCALRLIDRLGLYLYYVGSRMRYKDLAQLFGILPQTVSTYLKEMRDRICRILLVHENSRIKFPDEAEKVKFADMIRNRYD